MTHHKKSIRLNLFQQAASCEKQRKQKIDREREKLCPLFQKVLEDKPRFKCDIQVVKPFRAVRFRHVCSGNHLQALHVIAFSSDDKNINI